GDGAVVDERLLLAAAAIHVHVDRVVAGVERASSEPTGPRLPRVVEDAVPALVPVDVLGRRGPEGRRFLHRTLVRLVVDALRHEWSSAVAVFRGEGKGTTPASRPRVLDNPDRQWQRAPPRRPPLRARRERA